MKNMILALVPAIFLGGCGALSKNYFPDEIIQGGVNGLPIVNDVIDMSGVNFAEYSGSANDAVLKRNKFISSAIYLSEKKCHEHTAKIVSNNAVLNVGMGSAAMLFSGAAAVVTPVTAAAQLAAGATVLSGVQSLTNKEVYADSLATAIVRSIEVAREKTKSPLLTGMSSKDYDFARAIVDLRAYHDSCSMVAGLIEITKSLSDRKPSDNEIVGKIVVLNQLIADVNKNSDLDAAQKKILVDAYTEKIKDKIKSATTAP